MKARTADPYRDLAVIDARAPRFNQAVVGTVALVATLTGAWPLLGLLAAQLLIGLQFGRRFCLPCVAYFELVQPLVGEGPLEDSRPPRFANILGALFLSAATIAHLAGFHAVGRSLGALVAGLALLAVTTGVCVGCEVYRMVALARGIRTRQIAQIDLVELGAPKLADLVVQFTHPLCSACHELEKRLLGEGRNLVTVDVSRRPDLARKYGVSLVPLAFEVAGDGRVGARL